MHKKFAKLIMGAAVLFTALATTINAATPVETHGALTTKGSYILDKNGKIVQLRGMSMYWSTPGWIGLSWYTAANIDALISNYGITVLRVAYDRNNGNDNGWSECQTVIKEAINKGIYVIIDWHSHTADKQQSAAVSFFTNMATTYKNTPNVIFEPYNEPITTDGSKDGSTNMAGKTWTQIKPYLQAVVNAIRNAGAQNLIIAGTPYFCQHLGVAASDPLTGTNIAYAFHFYAASHGPEAYFVKNGDGTGGEEANYFEAGVGRIPIFVTEWGTTHSDGSKDGVVDATNTAWWFDKEINKNHISHCNWSVSGGETSSAFSGSISSLSQSGQVAMKYIKNAGTDTFDPPWILGDDGPGKDTVFSMPGTHQTSRYNKYYGGVVKKAKITYALRDQTDRRNGDDTCLTIGANGNGDEWVDYYFNFSKAVKKLIVRYLDTAGTASADVLVDGTKSGSISLPKGKGWQTASLDLSIAAGKHTVRFAFGKATGIAYIEWAEFSDGSVPEIVSKTAKIKKTDGISLLPYKNGFSVSLSSKHNFTSFSLLSADGRCVRVAKIAKNSPTISCSNIPDGIWFVKLNGKDCEKRLKVVISK